MPAKKYRVNLEPNERKQLLEMTGKGEIGARKMKRAQILLKADEGWKDADIVRALQTSRRTVERTRTKCVEMGVAAAINHTRPRKTRSKVLDGAAEARLAQLACSQAPDGHESWTLQMLADKLIELEVVETVSRETVRTTLKKRNLSLG